MNDMGKRNLTRIKQRPEIYSILTKLMYRKHLINVKDAEFLYAFSLTLIDDYEKNQDKQFYLDYAYLIIAQTSLKINDFRALYDFTVNYGYYPVSRKITQLNLIKYPSINQLLAEITMDNFADSKKMLTYEQKGIFSKVLDDVSNESSFLAPTSYGKSEIIFKHLSKYDAKSVGIILPTKALIDQFYRESKKKVSDRKVIVHDQNFDKKDKKILAIVTQERALRLIEDGVVFDRLYVDEAHEILDFDFRKNQNNRSLLLARLIQITQNKNSKAKILYFSPVVNNSKSLKIKKSKNFINEHKIMHDLKLLNIKFLGNVKDKGMAIYQYDRYLGDFIKINDFQDRLSYIMEHSNEKNLHFLYRPFFIEQYAKILYERLEKPIISSDVQNLILELKEIVHDDFLLAKYLEKGIVYLHSRLPSVVKNYVLKFVRESKSIKHFIANSVVLAGMNLPIDNLFYICGYANLRDLYNLIGRVNRLNEIFSPENNDLSKIFIPVHFIEFSEFPQYKKGSLQKKLKVYGRIFKIM